MEQAGAHDLNADNTADPLMGLDDESMAITDEAVIGMDLDREALQEVAEQTLYGEIFLTDLISRQLALSFAVALTFLATLFALPLLNYLLPAVATIQLFGFTLSWLFAGVLIYPLIWGLAYYFVGTCKKFEDDFTRLVK